MTRVPLLVHLGALRLLATKAGLPKTTGDAAEGDEQEKHCSGDGADDDTCNLSTAKTTAAAASSTNGFVCASCPSSVGSGRSSLSNGGNDIGRDNSRGAGNAIRRRVLGCGNATSGDDDSAWLVVARSCRALAIEGTSLPAGAADGSASFLLVVLGDAVNTLGGLWSRLPPGHESAGEGSRLGPCRRLVRMRASAGSARCDVAIQSHAAFVRFTANLVVRAAVGATVSRHEIAHASIVEIIFRVRRR